MGKNGEIYLIRDFIEQVSSKFLVQLGSKYQRRGFPLFQKAQNDFQTKLSPFKLDECADLKLQHKVHFFVAFDEILITS